MDYETMTDPQTHCFLSTGLLLSKFETAGVKLKGKIIIYCGGGIGATMTGFALKLLGHDDIAIYDGSLIEWSRDLSLPMTDPAR